MKKSEIKKREHVIICLLARLTDFQLQSNIDKDFENFCEDLREYLSNYNVKGE